MAHRVLRRADHTVMPWANGTGTTEEVARADGPDGLDWRLSFATVAESGPFSALPGIDRVITLVEGASLTLAVEGSEHVLVPFAPYRFRGEDHVVGTPEGASVDFNVMTRRGRFTSTVASVELTDGPTDEVVLDGAPAHGHRFVAVLDGSPRLGADLLGRYDVVRAGLEPLALVGAGRVAVVDLLPVQG
ncbi:MAG TPA: HutD family protein [Nocardioides sp.]|nr:HutD family protein [Nocardioides sp.]